MHHYAQQNADPSVRRSRGWIIPMQKHIAIATIAKLLHCSDTSCRDPNGNLDSDLIIGYRRVPASREEGVKGKKWKLMFQ